MNNRVAVLNQYFIDQHSFCHNFFHKATKLVGIAFKVVQEQRS